MSNKSDFVKPVHAALVTARAMPGQIGTMQATLATAGIAAGEVLAKLADKVRRDPKVAAMVSEIQEAHTAVTSAAISPSTVPYGSDRRAGIRGRAPKAPGYDI